MTEQEQYTEEVEREGEKTLLEKELSDMFSEERVRRAEERRIKGEELVGKVNTFFRGCWELIVSSSKEEYNEATPKRVIKIPIGKLSLGIEDSTTYPESDSEISKLREVHYKRDYKAPLLKSLTDRYLSTVLIGRVNVLRERVYYVLDNLNVKQKKEIIKQYDKDIKNAEKEISFLYFKKSKSKEEILEESRYPWINKTFIDKVLWGEFG